MRTKAFTYKNTKVTKHKGLCVDLTVEDAKWLLAHLDTQTHDVTDVYDDGEYPEYEFFGALHDALTEFVANNG